MPFEPPHFIRSLTDFRNNLGAVTGGLFLFYVISASSYVNDSFGCGLNNFLKNNFWARHVIGILTIFLFTNVFSISKLHIAAKLFFSIGLYMIYWLSNKSITQAQTMLVLCALVIYFIQVFRSDNDARADGDTDLSDEDKATLKETNNTLSNVQFSFLIIGLVLLILGHVVYIGKKKLEYGAQYSWCELIRGEYPCKGTDRRVYTLKECLEALRKSPEEIIAAEKKLQKSWSAATIKAATNVALNTKVFSESADNSTKLFSDDEWVDHRVPSGVQFFKKENVLDEVQIRQKGNSIMSKFSTDNKPAVFNNTAFITGKNEKSVTDVFEGKDELTILSLLKAAQAIQSKPSLKNASDENMLREYATIYSKIRNKQVSDLRDRFLESVRVPLLPEVSNQLFLSPATPSSEPTNWLLDTNT